ncbi:MAG TPA: tRNA (adenosine(37)-N6)-threonylcarbamoyltransferase complex ATPase subunit type 1 TsaE [Phycisphaerae bacterium]|nr:tRNA (adenosine(37)-N6)-threonylcarbamoyltransferase complex ATPase subunit type 1 TsaE [Phycisphaerae bacterium]
MNPHIEIHSTSVEETLEIGRILAAALSPGDVVGLVGGLGAGKTHLVKGIAAGLGVADERRVNSPTFVLVNEYDGKLHIFHVDAYRLSSIHEMEALGFEEMCLAGGVVFVEWADRVADAIGSGALWIDIEVTGDTQRRLTLRTTSVALAQRLAKTGLDRGR